VWSSNGGSIGNSTSSSNSSGSQVSDNQTNSTNVSTNQNQASSLSTTQNQISTNETSSNSSSTNNANNSSTNQSIDRSIGQSNLVNSSATNSSTENSSRNTALITNSEVVTDNPLGLESGSAILIEQSTGQILYDHNMHEPLRPASVTKVMSILLIMEAIHDGKISLTDSVPCSENAASMGGSQIWLDPRETLTVDEMLKAICVNSANDCVVAMSEFIAGSEEAFVQLMNDKAQELGMNDTCFKNCHGLDEDGHVTSSYDIALMSRELLSKYSEVTKYTTIWMDSLRDGKSQLSNTNKLIKSYQGATGLKTGSTSLALYNLSASATRDGLSLIAVIMKAPSTKVRFAEATKLLDYGFGKFAFKSFGKQGDLITSVSVGKANKDSIDIVLENSTGALIQKGKENQVSQVITLNENVSAPVSAGQKLGEASFVLDGQTLSTVNLVAKDSVEKKNWFSMGKQIIYSWIDLLRS
jgi:D-alanyl-D-alanine carboxypeptidase (penicillin-binding protein 5/6)